MQNADFIKKKWYIIKDKNLLSHIKIGKGILMFDDIKCGKNQFYRYKNLVLLRDIDIQKVLVSNKISFGEKNYTYFIGYLYNNRKIKPLHIIFSKTSAYVKSSDG